MDLLFDISRWAHIICGFVALLLFWIPIITKKGSRMHVRIGWIYVVAMATVSVTALYMGIYRITWNPGTDEHVIPFSWFLIFISILSGAAAWYGIRVLRYKKRSVRHRHPIDLLFPALLFASGVGICIYGWIIGFPLLQYFPLLGLFLGSIQLAYWLSVPTRPSHWIVEHLIGMLTCCIATVTAFIVFGAPRLLGIESVHLLIWFIPTLAIVPVIIGFSMYYQKKMDQKRHPSHPA